MNMHFIRSFVHPSFCPPARPPVRPSVCPSICPSIRSFIRLFIHSFRRTYKFNTFATSFGFDDPHFLSETDILAIGGYIRVILTILLLHVWGQPAWPHHAGPTRAALASGAPADPLQTRLFGVQVAVWASSSVPGGWCLACRWQRTTSAAICQWQNLCRSTDSQQFRRQKLRCCWTQSMECSTARTPTWHQLSTL